MSFTCLLELTNISCYIFRKQSCTMIMVLDKSFITYFIHVRKTLRKYQNYCNLIIPRPFLVFSKLFVNQQRNIHSKRQYIKWHQRNVILNSLLEAFYYKLPTGLTLSIQSRKINWLLNINLNFNFILQQGR